MTCLSTHHAAPSTQPFSLAGREPGKTPTGRQGHTLPGWWVRCGDRLEGRSYLQSHQTFPSGLERPQDYRHRRLVPHDPQPSPPALISSPPGPSPSFFGLPSESFSSEGCRQAGLVKVSL